MTAPDSPDADDRFREADDRIERVNGAPKPASKPELDDADSESEFDSIRRRSRPPRQEDLQHLRILSIFHYVVAGLACLCAMIPIVHLVLGIGMLTGSFKGPGPPPPASIGIMFIGFSATIIVLGWIFAICLAFAGYFLSRHRRYMYCFVMAIIACFVNQPFGVALGVFTIVVLVRPSVKELFGRGVRRPTEAKTETT
jgi:hypothetical protein